MFDSFCQFQLHFLVPFHFHALPRHSDSIIHSHHLSQPDTFLAAGSTEAHSSVLDCFQKLYWTVSVSNAGDLCLMLVHFLILFPLTGLILSYPLTQFCLQARLLITLLSDENQLTKLLCLSVEVPDQENRLDCDCLYL